MNIKILAFGIAKEIVGGSSAELVIAGTTIGALKENLVQLYPALTQLTAFSIAVNGEYAPPEKVIKPGDEVAIIPPVSGG
jgi:molybdopterin converting factor subunit 1